MTNTPEEIRQALEEAKRAREDAERLREEARRAREEARRLRDEARRASREASREERLRSRRGPGDDAGDPGGIRSEHTFTLDAIRQVVVDATAGKVTVRRCAPEETPGVVSVGSKTAPALEVRRDGDRLVIEVKLVKGWLFRRRQGATTVVRLDDTPLESLRLVNGYGEAELNGVAADEIRVNVGAGSVQCIQTRGHLDVNVGAGKVSVLAHSGLARADSGTGDVLLDIAEVAPGDYRVDVGLGRGEARFPAGAAINIRASSGIGKIRSEYPSSGEDAPARLRINSGIGEVIVRGREEAADAAPGVDLAGRPRPQRGARAGAERRREAEELRVLQLLEQGKISPQDAADLIAALRGSARPDFGEDEPEGP
ncbi:MAG: hypothetical protein AMXMBFR80_23820 [Dehalococcoidia bacterium]|jgi:hypothetical protein|nr:hypothetical protein [Tepidiformaceae bacterium]